MAGLAEMEAEPPPQSESSMFPPLLQPAPQPFCNLQTSMQSHSSGRGYNSTQSPQTIPVPATDQPRVDVMWADRPSPHRPELTVAPSV